MTNETPRTSTVSISDDGLYRGVSVHTPYPLEEADFLKLTKINSLIPIWAHTFLTGAGVFLTTIIAKLLNNNFLSETPSEITNQEWITLTILAIIAVIFEAIYFLIPSEKKKTIKKINNHFSDNTPKAAGFDNG